MFENIMKFFKKLNRKNEGVANSKDAAKERLHLVLMQDRANVSADFLELMKQEIIEVIKKYIDVDENAIDVRLTNKENNDGTNGAPALYANIPIINIKNEAKKVEIKEEKSSNEKESKNKDVKEEKVKESTEDNKEKIEEEKEVEEVKEVKEVVDDVTIEEKEESKEDNLQEDLEENVEKEVETKEKIKSE